MLEFKQKEQPGDSRYNPYAIYENLRGKREFICDLEMGIGHCCKVSTLCHFTLYGWLNDKDNVQKLITFLKDNYCLGRWYIKEVLIFSAPESERCTTALLSHPEVKKVYEFPRYMDPDDADGARNSIIMYSLRIS